MCYFPISIGENRRQKFIHSRIKGWEHEEQQPLSSPDTQQIVWKYWQDKWLHSREREWMNAHVDISVPRRAGQRKSVPRYRVIWRLWFRDKWISEVARDTSISICPNIHAVPWSPACDFASLHAQAASPWGEPVEETACAAHSPDVCLVAPQGFPLPRVFRQKPF